MRPYAFWPNNEHTKVKEKNKVNRERLKARLAFQNQHSARLEKAQYSTAVACSRESKFVFLYFNCFHQVSSIIILENDTTTKICLNKDRKMGQDKKNYEPRSCTRE